MTKVNPPKFFYLAQCEKYFKTAKDQKVQNALATLTKLNVHPLRQNRWGVLFLDGNIRDPQQRGRNDQVGNPTKLGRFPRQELVEPTLRIKQRKRKPQKHCLRCKFTSSAPERSTAASHHFRPDVTGERLRLLVLQGNVSSGKTRIDSITCPKNKQIFKYQLYIDTSGLINV